MIGCQTGRAAKFLLEARAVPMILSSSRCLRSRPAAVGQLRLGLGAKHTAGAGGQRAGRRKRVGHVD